MAVVLLPTPPFWFTMATTDLTAGILARASRALLPTPYLVVFSQAHPRYGGICAGSLPLFLLSPETFVSPRSQAIGAHVWSRRAPLPGSPPLSALRLFPPDPSPLS